jgi:hypothetical protein
MPNGILEQWDACATAVSEQCLQPWQAIQRRVVPRMGALLITIEKRSPIRFRANWAVEQLQKKHDKTFFLDYGLYAPHYPIFFRAGDCHFFGLLMKLFSTLFILNIQRTTIC